MLWAFIELRLPEGRASYGLKQDGRHWGSQCSLTLAKVIPEIRRKEKEKVKSLSRVQLFATLWTVAHQAPLSMEFSGKSRFAISFSGDRPDPGTGPRSPVLQADTLPSEPPGKRP